MALRNMGIPQFKALTGATKFNFLKNPKTTKLFVAGDDGRNYKAEQDIDYKKPIVVLMDDDDLETACFINERTDLKPEHTL